MLVNIAYLRTLGLTGLAGTMTPAADAAARWLGSSGEIFVSAAIAISTFGFLDLAILAPTRVYYAMANDGAFFPALARLHPRFRRRRSRSSCSRRGRSLLTVTGEYGDLLDTVVFADWIFFGLTVAGLFVLRRRLGNETGFRTPGYPLVPGFFVAVAMVVVYSTIRTAPLRSAVGGALLLLGIPVFVYFSKRSSVTRA